MSRSRDLYKRDRLALRDVVQVWILSMLTNALPLAAILLLAPGVNSLRAFAGWLALLMLAITAIDIILLIYVIIKKLIER